MSEENPYTRPVNQVEDPPIQSAVPSSHNYASLGARFSGKLIDVLIMIPLGLVIGSGYAFVSPPKDIAVEKTSDLFSMGATGYGYGEALLLAVLGMAAYIGIQWTFWASTGQSIGKKAMKTQIVNLDGSQASAKTIALKRYAIMSLIANVPVAGSLVSLIGVLLIFRRDRNCLHDDIAKTRVVKFAASSQ
ncbi:RDD family protein [Akkermansiaceae bacterium]|nr:RDD family protein [Akkermansiaceae bacterium]